MNNKKKSAIQLCYTKRFSTEYEQVVEMAREENRPVANMAWQLISEAIFNRSISIRRVKVSDETR
jgi:hypothetical protein